MIELDEVNKSFWLEQLSDIVKTCQKCRLYSTRNKTVYARGTPDAPIMFIGEAPGQEENKQGVPFCGRAGILLDRWLSEFHIQDKIYICNICKCHTPGNRIPEQGEIEACLPYLKEQIEVVKPKVIVLLGGTALKAIFGNDLKITRERGITREFCGIPTIPTYHPAFILRQSSEENIKAVKEDLTKAIKLAGL